MNQNHNIRGALKSQRAKYVYAFLGGFILASMAAPSSAEPRVETREVVKEVPKVQTVERTPESCKDALNIDNQIFVKVGQALGTFQFDEANAFMTSVKDERTAKYGQCLAS